MITTADVLEVMTVITACHHKTAPRMDDEQVTMATAKIWLDLLARYDFTKDDLVAAVKSRAEVCPDAPEAADVIRVARAARSDRMERAPLPEFRPPRHGDDDDYDYRRPGDAKAASDPGEYPREWSSEQRLAAYWHALRLHAIPSTAAGWKSIATQLERKRAQRTGGGA